MYDQPPAQLTQGFHRTLQDHFPSTNPTAPRARIFVPPPPVPPPTYPRNPHRSQDGPSKPRLPVAPSGSINWGLAKEIITNQNVEVNLVANGWALGTALTVLEFFQVIAGWGYKVRYRTPEGQEAEDIFPERNVRPVY